MTFGHWRPRVPSREGGEREAQPPPGGLGRGESDGGGRERRTAAPRRSARTRPAGAVARPRGTVAVDSAGARRCRREVGLARRAEARAAAGRGGWAEPGRGFRPVQPARPRAWAGITEVTSAGAGLTASCARCAIGPEARAARA
jgi:hypothetical protein